jgi:hypothetical protein
MSEERAELTRLAKKLCDLAGWDFRLVDDDGMLHLNTFRMSVSSRVIYKDAWLPLAEWIVASEATVERVRALLERREDEHGATATMACRIMRRELESALDGDHSDGKGGVRWKHHHR